MRHWLLLATSLTFSLISSADTKEFVRDYTYVAGEADSKISARQMAMQEVKRELLSEIGTHIYSKIELSEDSKKGMNTKQEIRALTAGFVKVNVLKEKWDGYKFYIKVSMVADPNEVLKRINEFSSNDNEKSKLKEQLKQSALEFERLRTEMLAIKSELEKSKSQSDSNRLSITYAEKSLELSAIEMALVAQEYYWGSNGKTVDYIEAKKWYQKAADQGYSVAQYNLAGMYILGHGVIESSSEAIHWFLKSANQGYAEAQFMLGSLYLPDKGDAQNYQKALYWYEKGADQGEPNSQNALALMYEQGIGVKINHQKAASLYKKAAKQGIVLSQVSLANMYLYGQGVDQDFKQVFYWYEKAAIQGHAFSQDMVAGIYNAGTVVEQSNEKAAYWYKKAA